MANSSLSYGALAQMMHLRNRRSEDSTPAPVLQVIRLKETGNRVRLAISDGQHFEQAMLTSQNIGIPVTLHCLVRVNEYVVNEVSGKFIIILLAVDVLETLPNVIGNPVANAPPTGQDHGTATHVPQGQQQQHQPLYQPVHAVTPPAPANNNNNNNHYNNAYGGGNQPPQPAAAPSHQQPYGAAARTTGSGNNPYGSGTKPPRPAPAPSSSYAVSRSSTTTNSNVTPIGNLTMYNNRFTIQAKIVAKSDIRTWSNANGEGSLFSIDLLDNTGDIRATFFKEAVDMFYAQLQVGQTYTFTGGRVKVANAKYNPCSSPLEITFDTKTEMHQVANDHSIQQSYQFVKIADLANHEANAQVDLLAVVKSVSEPSTLISKKTGNEMTKCEIMLVDDSNAEICLTLWNKSATSAPAQYPPGTIAAFNKVRISDYNGKSLNDGRGISKDYTGEDRNRLQHWWNSVGQHGGGGATTQLSGRGNSRVDAWADRKMISSIVDENLGNGDSPDWITFKCVLTHIRKDKEGGAWYTACPNDKEPCKNRFKVSATPDGQWHCEKCQHTYPHPTRRWIFSGVVEDTSGSTWVSFFNEQAEPLLGGVTADEAYSKAYEDGYNQDAYDSIFARALYTEWIMKCKVKAEIHEGNSRVKAAVYSLQPVDYVRESKELLAAIEQM
jgi:replication factor A1